MDSCEDLPLCHRDLVTPFVRAGAILPVLAYPDAGTGTPKVESWRMAVCQHPLAHQMEKQYERLTAARGARHTQVPAHMTLVCVALSDPECTLFNSAPNDMPLRPWACVGCPMPFPPCFIAPPFSS
jgi:hypothetical protein